MSLGAFDRLDWKRPEWVSLGLTFCILMTAPLMNGYPFVFADTWGYAGGICPDKVRSPILGCAMRPAAVIWGTWGYVAIQSAVTSFTLVLLSVIALRRAHGPAFYLALVVSGVGLFSGYVMADVWTLTGFICLFAVAMGCYLPAVVGILMLSFSVHYGNFPVFTTAAVLFLPFAVNRLKYAGVTLLCIFGAVFLIVSVNLLGGEFRFSPKMSGFISLSARILHDVPETIEKKCSEDPDFELCRIKDDIVRHSQTGNQQWLTWRGRKELDVGWEEFNRLSKEIVVYSVREFFLENVLALPRNTYRLFSVYDLSTGVTAIPPTDPWVTGLKRFFPDELGDYRRSWQTSGKLSLGLKKAEGALSGLFALSVIICLVYAGFNWKRRNEDACVKLSIFSVIAVLANAFFMSNLSCIAGRYHTRIGALLFLPATAIAFQAAHSVLKRIGATGKKR